jgi:hypothetical protein
VGYGCVSIVYGLGGVMAGQEMVIFTRTFDFLTWLLPVTNNFPRAHRHTFTRRLLDAAFDLRERLEEANHARYGNTLGLRKAVLRGMVIIERRVDNGTFCINTEYA